MATQASLSSKAPSARPAKERRCCLKKCPNQVDNQFSLFLCGNRKCLNHVHSDCYANIVEKKAKTPLPQLKDSLGNNLFFCKITCYRAGQKTVQKFSDPNIVLCWNEDGANGPDDPNHSEALLVSWLTAEGNYSRFRGNAKGQKKIQIAEQVARQLAAAKVRQQRKPKDVLNKIKHIESQFRSTFDYTQTQTGEGLKENDPKTFEEKVLRMCPYYNVLFPILATRASSKALCTNEDEDSDSDDNDNNNDDEEAVEEVDEEGSDDEVEVLQSKQPSSVNNEAEQMIDESVRELNRSLLPALDQEVKKAPTSTSIKKKNRAALFPSSVHKPKKPKYAAKRDAENEAFLAEALKMNQKNKSAELQETARHNRVMENLQRNEWQEKKEELEYKKKMVGTYMNLKNSGFDHDYISDTFPELVAVFPKNIRVKYLKKKDQEQVPIHSSINVRDDAEETSDLSET